MKPIVQSNYGVTLLGASAITAESLQSALSLAPMLVAADGGADAALSLGQTPAAVIGDLDSISDGVRGMFAPAAVHHIAEQDSTDFDKCLRGVSAPFLLALGFTGARLDHSLAAFSSLSRHPQQRCILMGGGDVCFLAPPKLTLSLPVGTRFSLFPMGAVRGQSTGLRWAIDAVPFAPSGAIGTSNEVSENEVRLTIDAPLMLVILPQDTLDCVLSALVLAPFWPHAHSPVHDK
jgi:thiamine pyrophosphokinase